MGKYGTSLSKLINYIVNLHLFVFVVLAVGLIPRLPQEVVPQTVVVQGHHGQGVPVPVIPLVVRVGAGVVATPEIGKSQRGKLQHTVREIDVLCMHSASFPTETSYMILFSCTVSLLGTGLLLKKRFSPQDAKSLLSQWTPIYKRDKGFFGSCLPSRCIHSA